MEAGQALAADLNRLRDDGFVFPFSMVAMDAQGCLYAGVGSVSDMDVNGCKPL